MKTVFLSLSLLLTSLSAFAQLGTLAGKVKDKTSGEPIIGATVFITGSNKGGVSDVNGDYAVQLEPGIYKIQVSYVSYKTQVLDNIKVEAGKTTPLHITIEENANTLNAVSIIGTRQTNTDITLLKELRQSEVVASGVSGEQIVKSLDRDAAETVKRIPGVTVMNDKYIVIRGMAERYNTVMLNDAFTPSTETDVKSFSFDLLPTSVIDRIMIYKAASPELPGDFGGGVIKVYTKTGANDNSTTFGISSSFRGQTTGQPFQSYSGGKTDFLGFDDGSRQIPGTFPANINQGGDLSNLARQLPNTWAARQSKALPDLRMSLGLARNFNLGEANLSNLTAISYSNTRVNSEGSRTKYNQFIPEAGASEINYDYTDFLSSQSARLGLIHNWALRLNERNKVEFRNLFNQLGASQVLLRQGLEASNGFEQRNYSLRYESRTMYSNQLQGTHELTPGSTLTWTGGYAYTNRDEPDYRRVRTQRSIGSSEPFEVAYKFTPSLNDAGRFYSKLHENTYSFNSQLEKRFSAADSTAENAPKIRIGFYAERKNRDFAARFFSYRPANPNTFDNGILTQPLDQVFAQQNMNPETGWEVVEGTQPSHAYLADNTYLATYAGGALPLGERLSAAGGLRLEHNIQRLRLPGSTRDLVKAPVTRLLPSLNLTYNFNMRSLLRLGSGMSLNRPEFRELALFSYYDFENLWELKGNPDLKTASIYNLDLRYEFYPNPTELISFGVFGKYFRHSIEREFENTNIGNSLTYVNADKATNYGLETEIRKSLLDLSASKFIQNMSVVLNASLIKSQVNITNARGERGTRALTGQSPYIVNTGLYYEDDATGLQATLLYNVIGPRIYAVGSFQNPTVFEMPRHVVDLSFTKRFGPRLEMKAGIQDLLNQSRRLIQDSNEDHKITGIDETVQQIRRGSYSTFGLSYKL
ncbi:MAG: TonB-dependent receptor domain-containing protein [Adhaeribacter sp.]